MFVGTQITIKVLYLPHENLIDEVISRQMITELSSLLGTTVIDLIVKTFSPQGLTGFALLKESHIAIHTWPEHCLFVLDIFSCKSLPQNFKPQVRSLLDRFCTLTSISLDIQEITV